jgi:alpha-tubulin suppressor-like RCC1 family protein
MPYQPVTNFDDSNGVDLGQKLVTKDYLLTVYGSILDSLGNSELTVTPALWVWGDNTAAQLGVNNATSRSTPVTTILGGTNWKSIAGGGYHTIATKTDGTLWVWGLNSSGELGVNSTTNRSIPVTTILGGTNWKSIAGGDIYRTIATKTDGTLWTWGNNNRGQLGINTTTNRSIPVTTILGGTNWKSISGGGSHTASVKTDGTLWTWGLNSDGQLGVNNTTNRSTPVTTILGGTNWKSVSCGENHMAAIKTDGTLWVWGLNGAGQLGVNNTTNRSTPVTTILGGTNWKQVSCGKDHMAAIKTDGTLWNWGDNGYEQLGVSIGPDRSTPVTTRAGGTNWKTVSCGGYSTTAIKTDGTLWVWGSNYQGQLGTNDTTDRRTPVTTILGGTNWKSVSVGYNTIAIRSDAYI